MNTRTRHDTIIRTLRRTATATVDELAVEVGVSRRTMLRDICALRDQGFVIHSECGPGGGLQLEPQSVQTASKLSVVEVFAVLISVATMRSARTFPFSDLADSALAKIELALPSEKVRELRALLDCLHVGQLSPLQDISDAGPVEPTLLPAFELAFLQQRLLRFNYRDAKGKRTNREVEPQAMLILAPLWYLVAWDPSPGAFRHFRMDRISSPTVIDGSAFRRKRVPFDDDVCPFKELR
ncbi:MAG: WYL domain-containing protein [Aquidulcibacter sp.]|jgi:predicted DNA-binding transcriptional regulator YafY|uniref:helix-turn-helix transcriptional regulator n=1 Tax=Aquidulcibacter sp. TaxID=2052990 RepID=UPI0022C5E8FE|nr:WYL domain-containing protein [Aquidulcibacter sp.]